MFYLTFRNKSIKTPAYKCKNKHAKNTNTFEVRMSGK